MRRASIGNASVWGVFVVGWLVGCTRSNPPPPPPAPAVTVARPEQREVMEWDEYQGYLEAVDLVEVRARVSGLIVATPFQEGASVQKGDLLVEIDARPYQAELEAAVAAVAQAVAQQDIAKIESNRIEDLPAESRTPFERDQAAATMRQAEAVLAAARANVELARLNLEWCRVTAPISGRISRKYVTAGNLVTGGGSPSAPLTTSSSLGGSTTLAGAGLSAGAATPLTTLTSIDPIYCYINADERSVLKYQHLARAGNFDSPQIAGVPCALQLSNETGFPHVGKIDFVDNRIDPGTGTIQMRGVFANAEAWLIPGSFARVRVPGSGRYTALLVPDEAVTTDQNQKVIWVVGDGDVVQPRIVKLGALFGKLRAIQTGLTLQDRVVINGLMQAHPGAKVAPQEGPLETAGADQSNAGVSAISAMAGARAAPASEPAAPPTNSSEPAPASSAPAPQSGGP